MFAGKMHDADEVDINVSVVGRLVAAQFPNRRPFPWNRSRSTGGTTGPSVSVHA